MAKYVTDEFRDALIKRAYQFCYGENDCSINPEIALAYLDAAEVLGADPNNDIRKEAKTKLSSVEDKNAFWKDEPQDEGFADQLGSLGIKICGGLPGYERDEKVGKTLMIAAATAGYNDYNMIDRVAGIYTGTFAFADRDLADLWNQRSQSYKAAEKSKAEERRAREHPQEHPQDMEKTRLEKFATSSLKMFPKELCKILETMSDNDVLNLMQIYDQHLSQSHDAWEKHSLILNMALTARETERIVSRYIRQYQLKSDSPLFFNRSGNRLTRQGIRHILRKYSAMVNEASRDKIEGAIHPHKLRHSKATHLVNAGVNIYSIRDFLGHESVTTTQVYLTSNPEATRKAIESVSEKTVPNSLNYYSPQRKDELLAFLDSLG